MIPDAEQIAHRVRTALQTRDLPALGQLLAEDVRWGSEGDPNSCHTRTEVLNRIANQAARGIQRDLIEVVPGTDSIVVGMQVTGPVSDGFRRGRDVYQVMRLHDGLVTEIRGYPNRAEAFAQAGLTSPEPRAIVARQVAPILNVSNLAASFDWFAKLGWVKQWDWRAPDGTPTFGAIVSGECAIFLCLNGQGSRRREGDVDDSQGTWLSIWLDDVDTIHEICVHEGFEVLHPPRNEPWGVREMQVRHPDGHVFRMSQENHHHH